MKFSELVEMTQNLDSGSKSWKVIFFIGDKKEKIDVKAVSEGDAKHRTAYLYLQKKGKPTDRKSLSNFVYAPHHAMKAVLNKEIKQPTYASPEISSFVQKSLPPGDRD